MPPEHALEQLQVHKPELRPVKIDQGFKSPQHLIHQMQHNSWPERETLPDDEHRQAASLFTSGPALRS